MRTIIEDGERTVYCRACGKPVERFTTPSGADTMGASPCCKSPCETLGGMLYYALRGNGATLQIIADIINEVKKRKGIQGLKVVKTGWLVNPDSSGRLTTLGEEDYVVKFILDHDIEFSCTPADVAAENAKMPGEAQP